MQSMALAARAAGHALGFDGKTLIHSYQVPVANQVFGPDAQAVADARRLIETMHVEEARALIARTEAMGQ